MALSVCSRTTDVLRPTTSVLLQKLITQPKRVATGNSQCMHSVSELNVLALSLEGSR